MKIKYDIVKIYLCCCIKCQIAQLQDPLMLPISCLAL